jgi:hypothetical protein
VRKTHYEVLGVTPTSTPTEIRSAYRKLVLKHHPDHSPDPRSADLLIQVVGAYEVLGDKAKRKEYDAGLNQQTARVQERQKEATVRDERTRAARSAAAAAAATQTVSTPPKPTKNQELQRLTALFSKGKFDEAEKLAYAILDRSHREPVPYVVLGDIARSRGETGPAMNMYAHAVQCDPRNALYQKRYEELVRSTSVSAAPASPAQSSAGFLAVAICVCAFAYIALSAEKPMMPSLGLINTWTMGLFAMLLLCGITAGAALSGSGMVDRLNAVSTTSLGKISPAMVVGIVAIVNFWAAAALYVALGMIQNAFNYSTSRVVTAVAAITLMMALAAHFSSGINGLQVLIWGGAPVYIGATCGWMVADALKRS